MLPAQPYPYRSSQPPICPLSYINPSTTSFTNSSAQRPFYLAYHSHLISSLSNLKASSCFDLRLSVAGEEVEHLIQDTPISIGNDWDEFEGDSMRDGKKGINKSGLKEIRDQGGLRRTSCCASLFVHSYENSLYNFVLMRHEPQLLHSQTTNTPSTHIRPKYTSTHKIP